MPEFTDLQEVFDIISENAFKEDSLSPAMCTLKNQEIMTRMSVKPFSEVYISRLLSVLKKKGKIQVRRKQGSKGEGLVRVITIL
jgi:hypothetical protein